MCCSVCVQEVEIKYRTIACSFDSSLWVYVEYNALSKRVLLSLHHTARTILCGILWPIEIIDYWHNQPQQQCGQICPCANMPEQYINPRNSRSSQDFSKLIAKELKLDKYWPFCHGFQIQKPNLISTLRMSNYEQKKVVLFLSICKKAHNCPANQPVGLDSLL